MTQTSTPASKTDEQLLELLGGTVETIKEFLPALNPAELERLAELEAAGKKRATLLDAIKNRLAAGDDADTVPSTAQAKGGGTDAAAGGKRARGEIPDYMKPDYSGPLTIEQAEWRNRNLVRK